MSKEIAQTVGNKKFGLLIVLLAALAVLATIGSQWKASKAATVVPDGAALTIGIALPAAPAEAVPATVSNPEVSHWLAMGRAIDPQAPSAAAPVSEVTSPSPGQAVAMAVNATSSGTSTVSGNCTVNCTTSVGSESTSSSPFVYSLDLRLSNSSCGSRCMLTNSADSMVTNITFGIMARASAHPAMTAEPGKADSAFGSANDPVHAAQAEVLPRAGTVGLTGFILLAAIILIPLGIWYRPRAVLDAYQGLYISGPSTSGGRGWISKRFGAPTLAGSGQLSKRFGAPIHRLFALASDVVSRNRSSFNKRE
jgi:hypothetical protein